MLYSYPGRCPGLSYVSPLGYQYQQVLGLSNHSTFELLSKIETSSLNSMTLPCEGGHWKLLILPPLHPLLLKEGKERSFGCGSATL